MSEQLREDLRKEIAEGHVVIVIGAGVSLAATNKAEVASWVGLLKDGLKRCVSMKLGNERWAESCLGLMETGGTEELIAVAELITGRLGGRDGGEYVRWLAETVGSLQLQETALLQALHHLHMPIVTTNYDDLLERVTGLPHVTWQESRKIDSFIRDKNQAIFHLHGYWDEPESVVFGVRSYEEILGNKPTQSALRTLLSTRALLFVGFGGGLSDPNFGKLREWISEVHRDSPYRHYMLVKDNEVEEAQRLLSLKCRILPLSYGPAHCDLPGFLQMLTPSSAQPYANSTPTIDITASTLPRVYISRLPKTSRDFFGRDEEIQRLNKAWADPRINILTFVAWGGVGKSALVNEWLSCMKQDNFLGANRVYGDSFYSQGTQEGRLASGDEFLNHALKWFGDPDPANGSPWDKGVRLAELVRKEKTLLILDGLEPMQYPPGEMQGQLREQSLQALLKELAYSNQGLCVITTRYHVTDIEHAEGKSVIRVNLENLSEEAGVELLERIGVRGSGTELHNTVKEFGCHALALHLLGRYLNVVHEGDVRRRDLIPELTEEEEKGGHARRVMESYERWLKDSPGLDILYLMGLFDRPASGGAIDALRREPAIEGLTDNLQQISHDKWHFALRHLRDLHLLVEKDEDYPDTLDCHPLVREHFAEKLQKSNSEAWREAHTRLYEFYSKSAKDQPETLEEMSPLLATVTHGCQAGLYNESFENIYMKRIDRNEIYLTDRLGAIGAELSLLANFFSEPWEKLVDGLTKEQEAYILSKTGLRLGLLGRHREAEGPLKLGLECYVSIEDWEEAADAARHLSRYYLTQGDLDIAGKFARKGVEYAHKAKNPHFVMKAYSTLGENLHYTGKLCESKRMFEIALQKQQQSEPEYPYLCRLHGFRYYELLLSLGDYKTVIECAAQTVKWPAQEEFILGRSLHRITLGRAYLYQTLEENSDDLSNATCALEKGLGELRKAQQTRHIPSGLLALAALHRIQGNSSKAWEYLEEAEEVSGRNNLAIHLSDYHIEAGWLYISQKDHDKVEEHINKAMAMVKTMGYKRREPDCYLLCAHFYLAKEDINNARESFEKYNAIKSEIGYQCLDIEFRDLINTLQKL